jgi:hypothetical protein
MPVSFFPHCLVKTLSTIKAEVKEMSPGRVLRELLR